MSCVLHVLLCIEKYCFTMGYGGQIIIIRFNIKGSFIISFNIKGRLIIAALYAIELQNNFQPAIQ